MEMSQPIKTMIFEHHRCMNFLSKFQNRADTHIHISVDPGPRHRRRILGSGGGSFVEQYKFQNLKTKEKIKMIVL